METLSRKHQALDTFFKKVISDTTVRKTKRIQEMLLEDSTWRYHDFMKKNKHIAHRLSLGDIAKYLGITQQSLSRNYLRVKQIFRPWSFGVHLIDRRIHKL